MAHHEPSESSGYETRDVRARGVVMLGAALVAVTALAMVLLWWMFNYLSAQATRIDPPVSPLAKQAQPAAGPQLEMSFDYRKFEQADIERLRSYGWVDREQRVVRIPIERAMELLAERGLAEPSGSITDAVPEAPPDRKESKP